MPLGATRSSYGIAPPAPFVNWRDVDPMTETIIVPAAMLQSPTFPAPEPIPAAAKERGPTPGVELKPRLA